LTLHPWGIAKNLDGARYFILVNEQLHLLDVDQVWKLQNYFLGVHAETLTLPASDMSWVVVDMHERSCQIVYILTSAVEN
jgi:hypothetical protein